MNHIYLVRFVVLKRPGFQLQKYGMPSYTAFFTMFLQLPIRRKTAPLSMKQNTTELLHNRL